MRAASAGKLTPLHKAIRKYGPEAFVVTELEQCQSTEHMLERERFHIKQLGTNDREKGYNILLGGEFDAFIANSHVTYEMRSEARRNYIGSLSNAERAAWHRHLTKGTPPAVRKARAITASQAAAAKRASLPKEISVCTCCTAPFERNNPNRAWCSKRCYLRLYRANAV